MDRGDSVQLSRKFVMSAIPAILLVVVPVSRALASSTPFTIHWTAPGDDGAVGRASAYDLRYATLPLNATNFSQATRILSVPTPSDPGTQEAYSVTGLTDGQLYYLALKTADEVGNWSLISNVFTRSGAATGVESGALALSFSAPWPNPANQSTHWSYSAPEASQFQVDVYDVSGRHVNTVASGQRAAGTGELTWDLHDTRGNRVDKGIYFVRARIGSTEWTKRLVVV